MSSNERNRRPLYAPPPRTRSTLSTYAPLILTLSVATAGLVAWIWSERRSSDDDEDPEFYRRYASDDQTGPPEYRSTTGDTRGGQEEGLFSRASGMMGAGVAAVSGGVAAASSALGFGGAEGKEISDRQVKGKKTARPGREREDGFSDHERWSEEAVSRNDAPGKGKTIVGGKRRAVAVVVSAEGSVAEMQDSVEGLEHASILSHLPVHHDPSKTDLFVLIYAPQLAQQGGDSRSVSGLSSSYATVSGSDRLYDVLRQQAESLVSQPTQILPFSTPTGYVHMLRHIAPPLVYLQDTPALAGPKGENLGQLKGWVGQTILVVGDDGSGGLADTETETEDEAGKGRGRDRPWYENSDMIGLGKGVEVVDVRRVGDDWAKRVLG